MTAYSVGQRVRISLGDAKYYGLVERIETQMGNQMLFVRSEDFRQLVPIGADRKEVEAA